MQESKFLDESLKCLKYLKFEVNFLRSKKWLHLSLFHLSDFKTGSFYAFCGITAESLQMLNRPFD